MLKKKFLNFCDKSMSIDLSWKVKWCISQCISQWNSDVLIGRHIHTSNEVGCMLFITLQWYWSSMHQALNKIQAQELPNTHAIYSKAVTWKQRGVACDDCEKWFHADCMHMSTPVYMALNNISWHCTNCGMPNFTSNLFESTIMSTRNSFSTLNSSHINNISTHSSGPPTSYLSPFNPIKRNKPQSQQHKIIIINFQSIKKRKKSWFS